MRFEHLCLTGTDTCLHHQQPVGCTPIICFPTDCAPSTAVTRSLPREKLLQCGHRFDRVTPPCPPAGAMIRRRKSVLFSKTPCTMFNLPASSFATCSKASRFFFKGPFRRAYFNLEGSFVFLPISVFLTHGIQISPFWWLQSVSALLFTCSRYSLA